MKIKKAIIPAAGLGTRFFPFTKSIPKEMINILDKPAIQFTVEELISSGIEDVLVVTSKNSEFILNHFDTTPELDQALLNSFKDSSQELSKSCRLHSIRQNSPLGLGHAISRGKGFIQQEPFLVALSDEILVASEKPILSQMIGIYKKTGCSVIAVQPVEKEEASNYGIVQVKTSSDHLWEVSTIIEKPDPDISSGNLAVIGRYLLTPKIFDILGKLPRGKNGEFQLTDAISELLTEEKVYAVEFTGKRYDVGNKLGFLQATVEFALKHPEVKNRFLEYLQQLKKGEIN